MCYRDGSVHVQSPNGRDYYHYFLIIISWRVQHQQIRWFNVINAFLLLIA